MPWLINLFRIGSQAAIGYFANDVATFIGKFLPENFKDTVIDKKKGGLSWWFVAIVMLLLSGLFILIFKLIAGKKGKLGKLFQSL